MEFLSLGGIIKEQAPVALIGVYTDKITVSLVKREKGSITAIATAVEPQEGELMAGGALDVARIALHCRKALAALPKPAEKDAPRNAVFALGGGMGAFSFAWEKSVRKAKERKITEEELAALIGAHTQRTDEKISRSFAESFRIDGFAVENPIGVNGGEVLVGVARAECPGALAQGLACVADAAGLSTKGVFDMRHAAAKYAKFFEQGSESAIMLCVFEHETSAVLVRNRAVAGIGVVPVGYGILSEEISKVFSVGREEARGIMSAYAKKELDAHVSERVHDAYRAPCAVLVSEITNAVAHLDPMSLLPGNVRMVSSDNLPPQMYDAFQSSQWLVALPMERNAAVRIWQASECKNFMTPFDFIIAESL